MQVDDALGAVTDEAPAHLAQPPRAAAVAVAASAGQLALAASFTVDGIAPALQLLLEEAALDLQLQLAPYHQVFQELLTPGSTLAQVDQGLGVLALRLEDYVRDSANAEDAEAVAQRTATELADALRQFAARARVPLVVLVHAPSPMAPAALRPALARLTEGLVTQLSQVKGLHLLDDRQVQALCEGEVFDPVADELGHLPFTEEYLAALALAIARAAHALLKPAHKVLVLDCDNTLWRGVVGEEGPQGISIPPAMAALQRFAVRVQAEGTLVCLASKNAEADVMEAFDQRPDLLLRPEHLVAHRINWLPKPQNLASLAQALNLGLDAFVFVDDNPVECAAMRAELPQVVTLQWPQDDDAARLLDHLWTFDRLSVTEEDLRRTAMYRENAQRDEMENAATNIGQFIASLQMVIDIRPPAEDEWPRLSQLTQKTNQFNFTTRRRSEAEVRALQREGEHVLSVHVRDRFGDYGLVGVLIARHAGSALEVDTFLLSCRVLGRGVEHAMVRRLGELAQSAGLDTVHLPCLPTAKNEPARAFADSVAAAHRHDADGRLDYRLPTAAALAAEHRPGADPEAVTAARKADGKPKPAAAAAPTLAGRSERYMRLATELARPNAVLAAVQGRARRQRQADQAAVAPATDTEHRLLALWRAALLVDDLGVEDDFFASGGSSLLAARLFADMARTFGRTLPLTTILAAPTVRALAQVLDDGPAAAGGGLVTLRAGGPRRFHWVHDGDGETLLYANLARRMPPQLGVFGLQPLSRPNVPLGHDRIEAMAADYVAELRRAQPHGPYLLGGMCAGGVIAFEMARQLKALAEPVELVVMLDAATPQALPRSGRLAKERSSRLSGALRDAFAEQGLLRGTATAAQVVGRKLWGAARYELRSRLEHRSVRHRFELLRRVLHEGQAWPAGVAPLSVREIYNAAERLYQPQPLDGVKVVLVRATQGDAAIVGDTPYAEIYEEPALGWSAVAADLAVVDVPGGHASMLQEPLVQHLFQSLQGFWRPAQEA